ncbi:hypothetical protein A0130_09805 [Leifsonia xyli]|uniref:carbohydrate kinase family protein n=1 Tax=Leifsonia xyli TaxID=1575 RepID=UPI0007CDAB09|nr:hypothetical protein A0130_09805 [Leifsonia xyli]
MNPATAPRALVVGESLVDVVERGSSSSAHPGGSPLNVAFGLARLGVPVTFVTEFGDDAYGELLAGHLRSAGVETINRPEGKATSVATARIDADGAAGYDFSLTWELRAPAVPPAELFHTGSIGALREPGSGAVRQLVEAVAPGTLVSFDPNIRPALMGDAAQLRDLVGWYCRHAHLAKLSDEDAAWLFPGWAHRAVLDWVLEQGTRVAVLTRGAHGSILRGSHAEVELPAIPTTVVDTIGAGDAYMAGLLAGVAHTGARAELLAGHVSEASLRTIGETASAVAALTVARAGAMPPTLPEVEALARSRSLHLTT